MKFVMPLLLILILMLNRNLSAQTSLDSGLVAYYPFNANANDHSGNENHGTVSSATLTEDRFDNFNSAYSFDGIDDYIDCGNDSTMYTTSMSITYWIKMSAPFDRLYSIINDCSSADGAWGFSNIFDRNGIIATVGAGENSHRMRAESKSLINDHFWHFVTSVYSNHDKTIKVYIDGKLKKENSYIDADSGFDENDSLTHDLSLYNWNIGRISGSALDEFISPHYFEGSLDDIRIYNRAITIEEIDLLYDDFFTNPDPTHLVLNGDFEEDLAHWATPWSVELSEERKYDGSNSVLVNTTPSGKGYLYQEFHTPTAVYQADFWIYPDSEDFDQLIEFLADWPSTDVVFHNIIRFSPDNFSSRSYDSLIVLPGAVQAFTWNHLSITSDESGDLKIYLNDELYFSFNNPEPIPVEYLVFGDLRTDANYGTVYYDAVTIVDSPGASNIPNKTDKIPDTYNLGQNYPNPFNPLTVINFQLPKSNYVELAIYNMLGQKIATLVSARKEAGNHSVQYNAQNLPSGLYYYRIKAGKFSQIKKMILLK